MAAWRGRLIVFTGGEVKMVTGKVTWVVATKNHGYIYSIGISE
jgi:hypothetical protein